MPNYNTMSTQILITLLKEWEEVNKRKPTRKVRAKITAIKKALAGKRVQ